MKYEQLELMKVIQFPKNRNVENNLREDKLQVAIKILEYFSREDINFSIIVDKKSALELFEETDEHLKDYLIISTKENFKTFILNNNYSFYPIKGNEFE